MNRRLRMHFEKLLLLLAATGLLASAGWFWRGEIEVRRLRAESTAVHPAGASSPLSPPPPTRVTGPTWAIPRAQSSGAGWIYEVFTPPLIYYNALAKIFSVTPQLDSTPREAHANLELLAVKFEPYRLQLVGCFGLPGDYMAAFACAGSSEIQLARVGHRFGKLGLSLESIEQKKVPVDHAGTWPVVEVATLARLRDELAGCDVILDSRVRKLSDTLVAVCRFGASDSKPQELHIGDSLSIGGAVYCVDRIQLTPPEVSIVRHPPAAAPSDPRILHLANPGPNGITSASPGPAPPLSPLKTGFVQNPD